MTVMEEKPTRNIARLAMEVGVSRQTLYTWLDEGCPVDRGANAVREWRLTYHPPPSSGSELTKLARARLIDAQSYAQEQKNLERDGELIAKESVAEQLVLAAAIYTARSEQLIDEIRKELPAESRESVAQRVDGLVFLALKELSANLRRAADGTA
jgi:phage terminase Nu1 subunit (DNA packaging protein)